MWTSSMTPLKWRDWTSLPIFTSPLEVVLTACESGSGEARFHGAVHIELGIGDTGHIVSIR